MTNYTLRDVIGKDFTSLRMVAGATVTLPVEAPCGGDLIYVSAVAQNRTEDFGRCFIGVRFFVGEKRLCKPGLAPDSREGQCQFYGHGMREYLFRFITPPFVTRAEVFLECAEGADIVVETLNVYTAKNTPGRLPLRCGTKFVAHLGMTGYAPVNTMAAFSLAARAGYRECVTNTNFTKDGALVALHNDTIDATSDGTGCIHDMTLQEARQYDFGGYYHSLYENTELPLLEDVLRLMSHSGMRPVLRLGVFEQRPELLPELVALVRRLGLAGQVTAKGFSREGLRLLAKLGGDDFRYGYCCGFDKPADEDEIGFLKSLGSDVYLDLHRKYVTREQILCAQAAGVGVEAWIVNDFQQLVELSEMGVTGFTTDYFPMDGCLF